MSITDEPPVRPKQRMYTPTEVSMHNCPDDLWVSFLGRIYDLTPLCQEFKGDVLLRPILNAAGIDITHWFDIKTQNIRTYIDPITGCRMPYIPMGRFIHIPPSCPRSDWSTNFGKPWWKDEKYFVGLLSKKTRKIIIMNTLISQEQVIEVCSEESLTEIGYRYLAYNKHAFSYTWKFNGVNLDMNQTLEENGIKDENDDFYELTINEDDYLPQIHLYFNDDLTEY